MKTYRFTYHTDPSHGWVEVPFETILSLGIAGKISPYSYKGQGKAYLEEDCDLTTFINAIDDLKIDIEFEDHMTNHDSWIRNLPRWGNP